MNQTAKRTYGLLAQYDDVDALKEAAEQVRDAGYTRWDSHSPFPVHGLDPAMGIRSTKLPLIIFGAGITGTTVAIIMQWWMNAVDYGFIISGKPLWSLPANIPIGFELTVLFAAVTAFLITLGVNGLPRLHHPLFNSEAFAKATDDKFFIAIEAQDPKYNSERTRALLEGTSPTLLEEVEDDSRINAKLPRPLLYFIISSFVFGFIPLGVVATMWVSKSEEPRIHPNPNMDFQEKFKAQTANPLFADGRAMRPRVEGSVPYGRVMTDHHYYRGLTEDGDWAKGFPEQIELSEATMQRGEDRFNIYCSTCHGLAGYGDGPVHRRAEELKMSKWVAPTSLHENRLHAQPNGKLFNTITHGIRNMPAYGHAIPEDDRWAIVMYIRALQKSQVARLEDVPESEKAKLQ